jgi:hypothetical protein
MTVISSVRSSIVTDAPGLLRKDSTNSSPPLWPKRGRASTSCRADRVGATPPESVVVMAMVPPKPTTRTR